MKKKPSYYERFIAMIDAQRDAEVAKFDAPTDLAKTRALSPSDRALHTKARRKAGRPKVDRGTVVISLSVERGLLADVDTYARKRGLPRASLVALALRGFIKAA